MSEEQKSKPGHIKFLVKRAFNTIFENLAKDLKEDVSKIQLGICFKGGGHMYEAYVNFSKVKDINLDEYFGAMMDLSGGAAAIDQTICQAGPVYAKEFDCPVDDISIVFQWREKELPKAVILKAGAKARALDIHK
ncbi:MAG TPA: hypothetical protein PK289_00055 [Bacteroidia bacterium]|nr:hypothetical protein [Bacteroidia bacterium]